MNETTVNLLKAFLKLDPNKRITTHEALKHQYFTQPLKLSAMDKSRHLRQPAEVKEALSRPLSSLPIELRLAQPIDVRVVQCATMMYLQKHQESATD